MSQLQVDAAGTHWVETRMQLFSLQVHRVPPAPKDLSLRGYSIN